MPWKSVSVAVSNWFKDLNEDGYAMLPTGFPSNRAFFAAVSTMDYDQIIKTVYICIGNGIITFQKWSPVTTAIPNQALNGKRWICVGTSAVRLEPTGVQGYRGNVWEIDQNRSALFE